MNEQWQELKETIIEMRDNNGTGTQQEVCKFLANLMEILEKQIQEPSGDLISRQAVKEQMIKYGFHAPDMTVTEFVEDILSVNPQEPSGDTIDRDELLKAIDTWDKFGVDDTNSLFRLDNLSLPHYVPYIHYDDVIKCIKSMPPVKQEPKTGHWIKQTLSVKPFGEDTVLCDQCAFMTDKDNNYNYCPNCGCAMVEPQERSEKE